ncbi:hypothetical protein MMC17_007670 [Xylographa soralifera]|nr:hypothetical protein [Xylographa soralifera]
MSIAKSTHQNNDAVVLDAPIHPLSSEPGVDTVTDVALEEGKDHTPIQHRGFQFWMVIVSLCIAGVLPGLESTVVTTSLPTIVADLQIGDNYIWIANVFFLTSAAVQPLFGQVANVFGRRWLAISIVAFFVFGSGICGGANSGAMLIAGRAIQGIGGGGLNMIVDVVISDLVPLRERGNFIAIILTVYSIGTTIGPFVGGAIVETTTWRWVFYLNLPIGGVAMVMLFMFLHVNYQKEMTFAQKLKRIDYLGNIIIITSSIAILFALTYGGARYAWSSWRIILPLVLGLVGLIVFYIYENSSLPLEPVTPTRLFKNRTSGAVMVITFLNSCLLSWAIYFLPVYFQAVQVSSPERSGVQILPLVLIAVPGAIIAVIVLTKYGRYRPLHHLGLAICTIGIGLFTLLNANSSMAAWVLFQAVGGLGSGMVLNTLLPAFQAPIPESDQAAATAAWAFIRSFGNIWGVAIPAAIFNSRCNALAYRITDPGAQAALATGQAYEHATAAFVGSFAGDVRQQIISVYTDSLKTVWQVAIAFSGLAFLLVFLEKEVPLRTELDTEYGLDRKKVTGEKGGEGEKQLYGGTAVRVKEKTAL